MVIYQIKENHLFKKIRWFEKGNIVCYFIFAKGNFPIVFPCLIKCIVCIISYYCLFFLKKKKIVK